MTTKDNSPAATVTTPAYVQFCAALRAKADEMGIPLVEAAGTETGLPQNANWVRFESAVNGHKIYVPKSAATMGPCETTLNVLMQNGAIPMAKVNGKIVCRLRPSVDLIASEQILGRLADPEDRIPANRPPTRKAVDSEPVSE